MPLAEAPVKCEVAPTTFRTLLEAHRYGVVIDELPFSLLVSAGKTPIYD